MAWVCGTTKNSMSDPAQSLAVKRAQVDFHNFASLGEPERALAAYADENMRRGSILRAHRDFVPSLTPFLEVGANAGHTSYMLSNGFQAKGIPVGLSGGAPQSEFRLGPGNAGAKGGI